MRAGRGCRSRSGATWASSAGSASRCRGVRRFRSAARRSRRPRRNSPSSAVPRLSRCSTSTGPAKVISLIGTDEQKQRLLPASSAATSPWPCALGRRGFGRDRHDHPAEQSDGPGRSTARRWISNGEDRPLPVYTDSATIRSRASARSSSRKSAGRELRRAGKADGLSRHPLGRRDLRRRTRCENLVVGRRVPPAVPDLLHRASRQPHAMTSPSRRLPSTAPWRTCRSGASSASRSSSSRPSR